MGAVSSTRERIICDIFESVVHIGTSPRQNDGETTQNFEDTIVAFSSLTDKFITMTNAPLPIFPTIISNVTKTPKSPNLKTKSSYLILSSNIAIFEAHVQNSANKAIYAAENTAKHLLKLFNPQPKQGIDLIQLQSLSGKQNLNNKSEFDWVSIGTTLRNLLGDNYPPELKLTIMAKFQTNLESVRCLQENLIFTESIDFEHSTFYVAFVMASIKTCVDNDGTVFYLAAYAIGGASNE